jgi:hypothetical protein
MKQPLDYSRPRRSGVAVWVAIAATVLLVGAAAILPKYL